MIVHKEPKLCIFAAVPMTPAGLLGRDCTVALLRAHFTVLLIAEVEFQVPLSLNPVPLTTLTLVTVPAVPARWAGDLCPIPARLRYMATSIRNAANRCAQSDAVQ